ncbi:MAG: HD domain-containing protein [Emergencia sp.]|jgi:AraC-like DNA-binding protein|nr:HD domain-containing protein [Emergencia sp.]
MNRKILNCCLQYIERNLKEPLSLVAIAEHAGYSAYHFSRLFQEEMRCTVMEYVRKRRLYKAAEEILNGKKIIDAACEYGWESPNSFARAFKQEYGFAPSLLKAIKLGLVLEKGEGETKMITCKNISETVTKEQLIEILTETMNEKEIDYSYKELEKMFMLSCRSYDGMKRYSGVEYITHPLHVAILLADLEAEEKLIYGGMFCDVLKKTAGKVQYLEKELPKDVWDLVRRVNDCESICDKTDSDVLLIKLAERLHNMRTIEFLAQNQIERRARETLNLFMPMARKLGNQKIVSELNDLVMKFM